MFQFKKKKEEKEFYSVEGSNLYINGQKAKYKKVIEILENVSLIKDEYNKLIIKKYLASNAIFLNEIITVDELIKFKDIELLKLYLVYINHEDKNIELNLNKIGHAFLQFGTKMDVVQFYLSHKMGEVKELTDSLISSGDFDALFELAYHGKNVEKEKIMDAVIEDAIKTSEIERLFFFSTIRGFDAIRAEKAMIEICTRNPKKHHAKFLFNFCNAHRKSNFKEISKILLKINDLQYVIMQALFNDPSLIQNFGDYEKLKFFIEENETLFNTKNYIELMRLIKEFENKNDAFENNKIITLKKIEK